MKVIKQSAIRSASIGLFLLLLVGSHYSIYGQSTAKFSEGVRGIEGTWQTIVTPRSCATGDPVAPPFRGILSFHSGGTLSGTSTIAPAVFGYWDRIKAPWENSFAFTNLRFNSNGDMIGYQIVRQEVELSPSDEDFSSSGTVEIFDTNGQLLGTGCVSSTGLRFS